MAYVITQNCCSDASCITVCPVTCIHPTPEEPDFNRAEMLYIDPQTCIDCGACADACPVDAIRPETALTPDTAPYLELNAAYYQDNPQLPAWRSRRPTPLVTGGRTGLRVAIVGSGPAAFYAARELLRQPGVEVHMYERLPVPYGLIRHGVAPDHPATKAVVGQFNWPSDQQRRFHLHLNVEIGTDLDHEDLLAQYHAVIYAYGASADRRLGIPGEDMTGSIAAGQFVGWYNAHPDHADLAPNLRTRRAVIIGIGNVALDVARILVTDPQRLAHTDIADQALTALRHSDVEEVVVLGRRDAIDAAFSTGEFLALTRLPGVDILVERTDLAAAPSDPMNRHKFAVLRECAANTATPGNKRIIFRFNTAPAEILGTDTVTGVRTTTGDSSEVIDTALVLRSIGFRGTAIRGVPFHHATGTVPNLVGRVLSPETGQPLTGVYTAGWIKRGPSGVIGTNRTCAAETVAHLLDDYLNDRLTPPRVAAMSG